MYSMDISEIRQKNARFLAESIGGINAFAEKIGRSQPQVSCLIGKNPTRKIGNKIAREIEEAFNLERDWLDHVHYDKWTDDKVTSIKPKQQESLTEELTPEAIEFAKAWQELPPEQRDLLAAFVYATQKPNKKVA